MSNKIKTTLAAVNGDDFAVLTGKTDVYPYDNGKRISDHRTGVRLNVSLQGNRLSPLAVRIEGDDPLPEISDEQIAELCKQKKFAYVKLINCVVSLYSMNGRMAMSATAGGAEIVSRKDK